jgi:hypothetical protein
MSAVNITDFEQALLLLGLYQREVSQTGEFGYAAQWIIEAEPKLPPVTPALEKMPPLEAEQIEKEPPSLAPASPEAPPEALISHAAATSSVGNPVNNIEMIVPSPGPGCSANCPHRSIEMVEIEEKVPIPTVEAQPLLSATDQRRLALLALQEEERQLFYHYVQELEKTGNLSQLPHVIRPYPKS